MLVAHNITQNIILQYYINTCTKNVYTYYDECFCNVNTVTNLDLVFETSKHQG